MVGVKQVDSYELPLKIQMKCHTSKLSFGKLFGIFLPDS